jgi:hypothetical protein
MALTERREPVALVSQPALTYEPAQAADPAQAAEPSKPKRPQRHVLRIGAEGITTFVEDVPDEDLDEEEEERISKPESTTMLARVGSGVWSLARPLGFMSFQLLIIGTIMLFAFKGDQMRPYVEKAIAQFHRLMGEEPKPAESRDAEKPQFEVEDIER